MLFFGYWSLWFLISVALAVTKVMKFTFNGAPSFLAMVLFSFIMAVPSAVVHYVFF